jgi:uncharacterized protein
MPWDVTKDDRCPASKPWAVVKSDDGELEGCHPTKDAAEKQQAALYANESSQQLGDTRMATKNKGLPMLGPERRFASLAGIEVRAATEQDASIGFKGHAAMFNKRSWIGPKKMGFYEEVREGAFKQALKRADVRMLLNHDPNYLLARNTSGTLRLTEDDKGLLVDADMAPTSYAKDLAIVMERGDLTQMSFSFIPVKEEWSVTDTGDDVRSLVELDLYDVSPVTFPAYTETDAALRAVGMDLLMEAADMPDEQRVRLASALRTGAMSPDLAPIVRAAGKALEALAQQYEQETPTRSQDDPLVIKSEAIRRQMRGYAALSSEWAKGT